MGRIDGRYALGLLAAAMMLPLAAGAQEGEACSQPYVVEVPNEPPETKEQMLEIQQSVKTYLADAEAYLACSELEMQKLKTRHAGIEDREQAAEVAAELETALNRYNTTVDEMHKVGNRFNALVAEYKARSDS